MAVVESVIRDMLNCHVHWAVQLCFLKLASSKTSWGKGWEEDGTRIPEM
jgi:hypothetical protein